MLSLVLILFALAGILFSSITINRSVLILALSALAIAAFSIPSLLFCFIIACINYVFIKNVVGKTNFFIISILFNLLGLAAYHYYEFLYEEWGVVPVVFGVSYLTLQFIDY